MSDNGTRPGIPARGELSAALALGLSVAVIVGGCVLSGRDDGPLLGLVYVPLVFAGLRSPRAGLLTAAWASALLVTVGGRPLAGSAVPAASFFLVALAVSAFSSRRKRDRATVREDADEARTALDVQHMMNSAYDLDMTLDLVTLKQAELLRCDTCAVMLAEGGGLRVRATSGLPLEARGIRFALAEEDHGWRPAEGRPQLIMDTANTTTRFQELDPQARCMLFVPLHSIERLVGMLYFGSREPDAFREKEVDRAEEFASNVVFAVQRALLEEELKRLAFTDAQTQLFNHRHFQSQLDEEVRRAQRYGRAVSLILLDIDSFKEFNDRYGHPAGDRLLSELANVVRSNLRTVDIPARYGGEEFVVICPETQKAQAMVLAERLCSHIATSDFTGEDGRTRRITVSIGVASYPADARTKADLVDAADKALYGAKRAGKNRVQACEEQ